MSAPRICHLRSLAAIAVFLLSQLPIGAGEGGKLRVTIDNSVIYAGASMTAQALTTVPLGRILDSDGRQGDFYRVTFEKDGSKVTGYIHYEVVDVLSEKEVEELAKQSANPAEVARTQPEIVVRVETRIGDNAALIKEGKDLDKAVENLRPVLTEVIGLEDLQKRKQFACNIYYWLGVALSKEGELSGAMREFRNMFDVDPGYAAQATKDVFDTQMSRVIELARKQHLGLITNFALSINTVPQGADVKVNGEFLGKTPCNYSSNVPKFTLELDKEGYASVKKEKFMLEPSETESIPLQSTGRTVKVGSAPPGARIFLDGKDTGKATDCELSYVPYGERRVRLSLENYADWEASFEVREGFDPAPVSALLTARDYVCTQKVGGFLAKPFKFPKAVAVDRSGNVYLADETDFKIRRYDAELRTFGWGSTSLDVRKLNVPAGLAVDGQGFVYVTDFGNSCVVKFDRTGKLVGKWVSNGVRERELSGPTGIAVDANNEVYVADTGNNRVVRFSSTGSLKKFWGKPGTGRGEFSSPTGIAVNSKNEILVVDKGGRIQKFTPDGGYLSEFGKAGVGESELNRPQGLCLDALGCLYVADTGNGRIQKFSPDGQHIACLGGKGVPDGPLSGPVAVAVNDKGAVFIVERDAHRVQEFRVPIK